MNNANMLSAMSGARAQRWREKHILAVAHQVIPGELESVEEWTKAVLESAEENMAAERDERLAIYTAINRHMKGEDSEERFDPYLHASVDALKELGVWGGDVSTSKSFACCHLSGNGWSVEVKCVEDLGKQLVYDDRISRFIAHVFDAFGISCTKRRLAHLFLSTSKPGEYKVVEYDDSQKHHGWNLFLAAKALWEISNKYQPNAEAEQRP